jgi:curli production assembly/transport component CsgG
LKILQVVEPTRPETRYKVSIEAKIARFTAPADSNKIKIVVAPIRFEGQNFIVGDKIVPATKLSEQLQQRIIDALNNTGRFTVLDREFASDVRQELDMIATGQTPSAEIAKLGQVLSADVVWTGRINSLAYNRQSRKLTSSPRELVSYTGGWAFSHRIINVATRQLLISDTIRGDAPTIAPTTLGVSVDSSKVLQDMEGEIASRAVESILARTFPIAVVSREGNSVVLSQGGQSIKENARYSAVLLGEELKDPQTGQSLGRKETPCCEVIIDKVAQNLSYGHLEGVRIALEKAQPGGLQLREQLKAVSNEPKQNLSESSSDRSERTNGKSRLRTAAVGGEKSPEMSKTVKEDKW